MPFALQLFTAPVVEPVSLTEAKARLKVTVSDSDDDITSLIAECRAACEKEARRAFLTQTWTLTLDEFPADRVIEIPLPPLASVTHVKYYDTSGVQQTFASSNYHVDTAREPGRVVLKPTATWPAIEDGRPSAVEVRFVAGATAANLLPPDLKHAVLILIAARWDDPAGSPFGAGGGIEIPPAVRRLLNGLETGKQWE